MSRLRGWASQVWLFYLLEERVRTCDTLMISMVGSIGFVEVVFRYFSKDIEPRKKGDGMQR